MFTGFLFCCYPSFVEMIFNLLLCNVFYICRYLHLQLASWTCVCFGARFNSKRRPRVGELQEKHLEKCYLFRDFSVVRSVLKYN